MGVFGKGVNSKTKLARVLFIVRDMSRYDLAICEVSQIHYEGVSINNQPIPFPMDRDGHGFSCFVSIYGLYMSTKLHTYRVIL